MKATIRKSIDIVRTPRVLQMSGIFDVAPAPRSELTWEVSLDLPGQWSVGVIVGPSGSGKTTIARELFGEHLVGAWDWPADKSLLDGFPAGMGIKDIAGLLSSVGFSSPPAWVRPFHVLSNGQQFRVHLARTLAEKPDLAVIDEFTSVVDRTVAKIGSAAVAKAVRGRGQKLVAVTCHYDVIDWLEPDWIYHADANRFEAADAARGSLFSTTSHPSMIRHRRRSALWKMNRAPATAHNRHCGGVTGMGRATAMTRLTAGFEYVGPPRPDDAAGFAAVSPSLRRAVRKALASA